MTSNSIGPRSLGFIVATIMFMQMLDGAIIATSLPVMAIDLGVPTIAMSVGITAYLLSAAIFMPMSAWLADRFGAVRVFLLAIILFTVASLACALARDLPQFVLARVLQGVGGAFMVPVGRAIVLQRAPKDQVLNVMAAMIWPALVAPVIGPVVGGFITSYLSWRYNFLLNLPIGVIGFLLVLIFVPESERPERRQFDWKGFFLSAGGLALVLTALEMFVQDSRHLLLATGIFALGVIACVFAVLHLRRSPVPLLSLKPFEVKTFSLSTIAAGSYVRLAVDAMPFLLPLFLQVGLGYDPLQAGGLMLAYFVGNLSMKAATTPILRRFGFRAVLLVNGLVTAVSIWACGFLIPTIPVWATAAVLVAAGLSRSMQFTALSSLAFAEIGSRDRGAASTLISIVQQVTLVLAVALATLILKLSQWIRGGHDMVLGDLQIAMVLMIILAMFSTALLRALPHDAGDDIAGRSLGEATPKLT